MWHFVSERIAGFDGLRLSLITLFLSLSAVFLLTSVALCFILFPDLMSGLSILMASFLLEVL